MNRTLLAAAALGLLAACGQPYSPVPDKTVPGVHGGDGVFGNHDGSMDYQTVSYDFLRSTLTDVVGVMPVATPAPDSPLTDPLGYLDANRLQIGDPAYGDGADGSAGPTKMVPGGYKAWIISSSSACGLMMQGHES